MSYDQQQHSPFNVTLHIGDCPDWSPQREFEESLIKEFESKTLLNPFKDLDCNPYKDGSCATSPPQVMVDLPTAVCAFKYSDSTCNEYSMITYESTEAATNDGASVTHTGACGLCSTAKDLATYMSIPDMTHAGKICAMKGIVSSRWGKKCYMKLGFTAPCSEIWNYDGQQTRKKCMTTCIGHLDSPNNGPEPACKLNSCLQCDEDEAGPIFKKFAARTRRRSGILSAITRGCDDFANIKHESCPQIM